MQSIAGLLEFGGHLRDLINATPTGRASWSDENFGNLALKLFALQYEHNEAYRRLCQARNEVQSRRIEDWSEIPAVPTSAFKDLEMTCLSEADRIRIFHSSGTTEHRPSRHFHSWESLFVYEESLLAWFSRQFQIEQQIPIVCLTPPREVAPHSSLAYMFESLRRKFGSERSLFLGRIGEDGGWTLKMEAAVEALRQSMEIEQPILVLGTAFSYVHLLDYLVGQNLSFKLPVGTVAMETGGYKGRSRAVPKQELHQLICKRMGISETNIICEYGMSELSSQAYDQRTMHHQFHIENPKGIPPQSPGLRGTSYPGFDAPNLYNPKRVAPSSPSSTVHAKPRSSPCEKDQSLLTSAATRVFYFPPWARAQVISPETGREVIDDETGLIRVFDLANVFSVMAIQTEDLGIRRGDGFELVGRASLAEARGCSLMAV